MKLECFKFDEIFMTAIFILFKTMNKRHDWIVTDLAYYAMFFSSTILDIVNKLLHLKCFYQFSYVFTSMFPMDGRQSIKITICESVTTRSGVVLIKGQSQGWEEYVSNESVIFRTLMSLRPLMKCIGRRASDTFFL